MGKSTSFLYLDEEDMIKAGALDSAHCIDVEEEIFKILLLCNAYKLSLASIVIDEIFSKMP